MKYITRFKTLEEALAAEGLMSPHISSINRQISVSGPTISNKQPITFNDNSLIIRGEYVLSGLTFHLSGVNKNALGSYPWVDLIGGIAFTKGSGVTELANGFKFDGGSNAYMIGSRLLNGQSSEYTTIEIVLKPYTITNWEPVISLTGAGSNSIGFSILYLSGYNGMVFRYNSAYSGASIYPKECTLDKLQSISTFSNNVYFVNLQKFTSSIGVKTSWFNGMDNDKAMIGTRNPSTNITRDPHFKGEIYEIRIYNRRLTDDEIISNHKLDLKNYKIP